MSFQDSGFLENDGHWIYQNRRRNEPWFVLASTLNRLAMSVLLRNVPKATEELYAATLYARAVSMYQGAILLVERGMPAESRTLVRGCAETAIALGCTRLDKGFQQQLVDDDDKHRLSMANEVLQLPESDPNISPEQRAELRRAIAEISARYKSPRPRRINWAAAASAASMTDLYLTVYRQTSSDAAHVSLRSLDRYLVTDERGELSGFRFQPFLNDTADTLSAAIGALCHATDAKLRGLGDDSAQSALQEITLEWKRLVEAHG